MHNYKKAVHTLTPQGVPRSIQLLVELVVHWTAEILLDGDGAQFHSPYRIALEGCALSNAVRILALMLYTDGYRDDNSEERLFSDIYRALSAEEGFPAPEAATSMAVYYEKEAEEAL